MAAADPFERPIEPIFPRLSGGPRRMEPDEVARHQRARLEGAMVEAVARHGFAGTTLRELVTLAGVSKSTFYEHFESKQACFLSTFDQIVDRVSRRVGDSYAEPGELRERLVRALSTYMARIVEQPAAASLAVIESLTLGSAATAHRERGWETFERIVQSSLAEARPPVEMSATTIRAILGGINGVVYRRLRGGRSAELPPLAEPLVDWGLGFREPPRALVRRAMAAAEVPATAPAASGDERGPSWEEPPDSPESRAKLSQRERIVRAAARVVVEDGYDSLSIPAISAAAGTSNQTFYEHFHSKRDAFLAAFEILVVDALAVTNRAFRGAGEGPEAHGAAIRALLEHIARHRMFARLAFFELPTAGPIALDRADAIMNLLTSSIESNRGSGGVDEPPRFTLEAGAAGAWAVIQREIAHDRGDSLPDLAAEITRLVLAPLEAA
jgi:AcrR family transcriptional regulator